MPNKGEGVGPKIASLFSRHRCMTPIGMFVQHNTAIFRHAKGNN